MFETLFARPAAIEWHRTAPLAREREEFLSHLHKHGTGLANLIHYAGMLNQIVHFLGLKRLRDVKQREIERAARRWARYRSGCTHHSAGRHSGPRFLWIARRWLRFHGRLVLSSKPRPPFADKLEEFAEFMKSERGFAPATLQERLVHTAPFLAWYSKRRHRPLCSVSLKDVDRYLAEKASGWTKASLASCAAVLRAFFRYAETRRWCAEGIACGIKSPPVRTDSRTLPGPKWSEVLQLLETTNGTKPVERRARPILLLFSLYGLRRGEVMRLLLSDFDWQARTFTVRRSKRGGLQEFPICRELSDAVLSYVRNARPQCACPNLFVSFHPPYRPIHPCSVSEIVTLRLQRLGIRSGHMGPHSLRHACATELLTQGSSLREIADFLGHRDIESVGIYAKVDMESLGKIAALDLCGAL